MNIIKMYNDYVKETIIGSEVEITKISKSEFFAVNKLKIRIKKDTDILINYDGDKEYKLDFYLEIDDNVTCTIKEVRTNVESKIRNTYILKNKSTLNIERYLNSSKIRLLDIVNLDKKDSTCNIKVRNIALKDNKYDVIIYHNEEITSLNLDYKSINKSKENINITDFILPQIKKYTVNHKVNIKTQNKENCNVNAYVLIDENKINDHSNVNIKKIDIDDTIIDNNSLEKMEEYWRWYDE